jgi:hypothetical protein
MNQVVGTAYNPNVITQDTYRNAPDTSCRAMPRTKFVTVSTNAEYTLTFADPTGPDKPDAIKILEPIWVKSDRPPACTQHMIFASVIEIYKIFLYP